MEDLIKNSVCDADVKIININQGAVPFIIMLLRRFIYKTSYLFRYKFGLKLLKLNSGHFVHRNLKKIYCKSSQ